MYGEDPEKSEFYGRVANERSLKRLEAMVDKDRKYMLWGGQSNDDDLYVGFRFPTSSLLSVLRSVEIEQALIHFLRKPAEPPITSPLILGTISSECIVLFFPARCSPCQRDAGAATFNARCLQRPSRLDFVNSCSLAFSHQDENRKLMHTQIFVNTHTLALPSSPSYLAPTLLDFQDDANAFHAAASMQEEIFGPIVPLLRVNDPDGALKSVLSRYRISAWRM